MPAPELFKDVERLADLVIERVGKRILLGLPLGLGKANTLANALYARAKADPEIQLTIYTALTLDPPTIKNELAQRFFDPLRERFFAGYPRLSYARALKENALPDNIQVHEFFLQPGQWLGNAQVQQDYVALNYTHVLRFLIDAGVNVIGQLIAPPDHLPDGLLADRYSLSCNPDISADLLDMRRNGELTYLMVGEVNRQLPYMYGAADRDNSDFDFILDEGTAGFALFTPPQEPVNLTDHAIGLHVARLVPDGGTLQIGIGSMGDAIAHGLILRNVHNDIFHNSVNNLLAGQHINSDNLEPFEQGLYGLSEMLTEGFFALLNAGVIKREVDGCLIHASFFLGSPHFYRTLAAMDKNLHKKIGMMPVSYVNELYGQEWEKRRARVNARFVNSAIMATLMGDVVSDGTENGQVISGVGGQYNFAAQAFALKDACSIITLRATRQRHGKVESNIRWRYGHTTLPRHLRDIIVTEYGVADLRGKSDAQVIAAMLNITDSRFQNALLQQAKDAKKIAADYQIPPEFCRNTPERIASALANSHALEHLPAFPLGCDFTQQEQQLTLALKLLNEQSGSTPNLLSLACNGLRATPNSQHNACLVRMNLATPESLKERFYRFLLLGALAKANQLTHP